MLPEIERIKTILAAHSSIVDLPDKEWLKQKFPDEVVSLPHARCACGKQQNDIVMV